MNLTHATQLYLRQLEANGRSHHSVLQAKRHSRALHAFLRSENYSQEVEEIDHETIARFLTSRGVRYLSDGRPKKTTTMNRLRSSIRCLFGYLHASGCIHSNPARLLRLARCAPPPPRVLEPEDQDRLLDVLRESDSAEARRDEALFSVMLFAGLRIGSAINLDVEDLNLSNGSIHLRCMKGGVEDRALIPPRLQELLTRFIEGRSTGALFLSRHGNRLSQRHAARRLSLWAMRAGIAGSVHPHVLRHSFAMKVYRRTHDLLVVQRALCHRSLSSTAIYARADDATLRAAIA